MRMTADGTLWAQWIGPGAKGSPHAGDVVLSRSLDDGRTWSQPLIVNTDGTATEHGFASLWPAARDRLGVAWLDGRATATSGPTMLRAATFATNLERSDEMAVDSAAWNCCRTSVTMAAGDPILAYRGRTPAEVRDTMVSRLHGGHWSAPVNVHADGWTIKGCPMNGPAIAANGDAVVVAWYTGVGDVPALRMASSRDGGQHYTQPLELSRNPRMRGRADVALVGNGAWVTWLDDESGAAVLKLARVDFGANTPTRESITLQKLAGHGHAAGYSRIVAADGKLYAIWSDTAGDRPTLAGADRFPEGLSLQIRPSTSVALVPPKPKLFDITVSRRASIVSRAIGNPSQRGSRGWRCWPTRR